MSKEGPMLGELVPGRMMGRDAVHVAVVPLEAGMDLHPGERVGLSSDGRALAYQGDLVGIVDPFLERTVRKGEMFWLCLFPNTITSLRHVWSHPAFIPKPPYLGEEPTK